MLNTTPYYSWQATSGDVVTNYDLIIGTHPSSISSVSPTITVDRLFIFVFVWACVRFEWWKASWHVQLSCYQNIQLSHDQNSWTCLAFLYVIVPLYKFSFGFGSNRKELMIIYVLKTNEDSFRSAIWTYGFDRKCLHWRYCMVLMQEVFIGSRVLTYNVFLSVSPRLFVGGFEEDCVYLFGSVNLSVEFFAILHLIKLNWEKVWQVTQLCNECNMIALRSLICLQARRRSGCLIHGN
jgi:hypothetical protein